MAMTSYFEKAQTEKRSVTGQSYNFPTYETGTYKPEQRKSIYKKPTMWKRKTREELQ